MSKKDDTGQIIQEFLELWQKQFSYIAKDPATVASMLGAYQQMQEGCFNRFKGDSNAQSSAATDVPVDVNAELRKLRQRITDLEKRVAELEPRASRTGKKTATKNPRPRSSDTRGRAKKPAGQ